MQILKNLYQVGGDLNGITFDEKEALWNDGNTYVLKTSGGLIMFDCGCGNTMDQIIANMDYWGLSIKDVKYCFITHPHLGVLPKCGESQAAHFKYEFDFISA